MTRIRLLGSAAIAAVGASAFVAAPAYAVCGLTTVTGGSVSTTYDPFSGATTTIPTTTLILKRINPVGGKNTTKINFFFTTSVTGLSGVQLLGQSIAQSGGSGSGQINSTGSNLFFGAAEAKPTLNTVTIPSRTALWDFAGNAPANDSFQIVLQVVLPPNLDTTAGSTIPFDLSYRCEIGSGGNVEYETGTFPSSLVLNVNVLSALRAYFNGQLTANTLSLDFGEVGDKTTVQVLAAPATYTKAGNVNVQSSGPYTITMNSTNNYRLVRTGAAQTSVNDTLTYSATFLGSTLSGTSGSGTAVAPISKTCTRGGVPYPGATLPLSVKLNEGGLPLKTAAPIYSDTLNITVTPLAAATPGVSCP